MQQQRNNIARARPSHTFNPATLSPAQQTQIKRPKTQQLQWPTLTAATSIESSTWI